MRYKGHIKTWDNKKGFGFIKPADGGSTVFVHISGIKNRKAPLQIDEEVSYTLTKDPEGRFLAENVLRYIDKTPSISNIRIITIACLITLTFYSLFIFTKIPIEKFISILVVYFILSIITFKTYKFDKLSAIDNQRRVPEKNLHLLSIIGGWPGAMLAQEILRHKSKKQPFKSLFWLGVVINFGLLAYVILQTK